MKYLRVKKWDEHQHYTDRDPPWIKIYNRLLNDYEFLGLSEAAQSQLIKLWLLASRTENKIPFDMAFITSTIGAKSAVDIDGFIVAGWLELSDGSEAAAPARRVRKVASRKKKDRERKRSNLLAERQQNASGSASNLLLEERREEKRREETTTTNPSPAPVVAASKPKKGPRWPHFPEAICTRLYTAWSRLGTPNYGSFRNAFGRLFPEVPRFTVEQLEVAIAECIDDAVATGRGEYLTPNGFVDRAAYWVDKSTPIAQRDPARAYALGVIR